MMAEPVNPASVLFFSPKTYNYHLILSRALEEAGITFAWLDERPCSHFLFKFCSRRLNNVARLLAIRFYLARIRSLALSGFSPSHVLIIKGEALHASVIRYIQEKFPQAKIVLYFWDSVSNLPGHTTILPHVDTVASFDYRDCAANSWRYYPLFSGNSAPERFINLQSISSQPASYDWSFVGAVHSDRLKVISRLLRHSQVSSRFFLYIYFPSIPHLLWFFCLSPVYFLHLSPYFYLRPLAPKRLSRIYAESHCVLDIHHPSQSGLTMRTIETLLSGRKIATTNTYISNEALFSQDRVLIIDRTMPEIPESFLDSPSTPIHSTVIETYRPVQWILGLLSL